MTTRQRYWRQQDKNQCELSQQRHTNSPSIMNWRNRSRRTAGSEEVSMLNPQRGRRAESFSDCATLSPNAGPGYELALSTTDATEPRELHQPGVAAATPKRRFRHEVTSTSCVKNPQWRRAWFLS